MLLNDGIHTEYIIFHNANDGDLQSICPSESTMFYNEQYKNLDIHDTTEKLALHSDF